VSAQRSRAARSTSTRTLRPSVRISGPDPPGRCGFGWSIPLPACGSLPLACARRLQSMICPRNQGGFRGRSRQRGLAAGRPRLGWVGGYLVVSWGVLQVTETVASLLGFPLWFGKARAVAAGARAWWVVVTALVQAGPAVTGGRHVNAAAAAARGDVARMGLVGLTAFALLGAGTAGHLGARAHRGGPSGHRSRARVCCTEDSELVLAELEDFADEPGVRGRRRKRCVCICRSRRRSGWPPRRECGTRSSAWRLPAGPAGPGHGARGGGARGLKGVVAARSTVSGRVYRCPPGCVGGDG
jgi:hypothetical protein